MLSSFFALIRQCAVEKKTQEGKQAWFKPATLQIHGARLSLLNYEDTLSNFYCFLRCLSWPVFVINLTLSFPLSQHFLRSILPRLAARREEGKNTHMRFEFWQRMPSRTTHIQNIRSVLFEWKDGKNKERQKCPCVTTCESKERPVGRVLPSIISINLCYFKRSLTFWEICLIACLPRVRWEEP